MGASAEPKIALGIVLDGHGNVLLIRRVGEERWFFPGGQVEAGESEALAVVREVMEETGVQCRVLETIGRRTHPESGRDISYWHCHALSDAIETKDIKEIAEARWVHAKDALTLLGGSLYAPAQQLLTLQGSQAR
jgi:8-oxo-dGTP diphosphatase